MDKHQYIALIKKEILQQATPAEQARLQALLAENEDFGAVYQTIFQSATETPGDTNEAYERHIQRMKNHKLL